jgi:hypothetical protein
LTLKEGKANLRWRIHEVELEQILDAERLEKQNGVGEVGTLNLGDSVLEQLIAEGNLGEEAIGGSEGGKGSAALCGRRDEGALTQLQYVRHGLSAGWRWLD